MELTGITRALGISPVWQFVLASLGTMLVLALLDFVGAVFAKEWADTRHPGWFVLGLASFGILFVFYASSLRTAELSIVTIGWVVFLQVGLVLYERFRFGRHPLAGEVGRDHHHSRLADLPGAGAERQRCQRGCPGVTGTRANRSRCCRGATGGSEHLTFGLVLFLSQYPMTLPP